MIQFVATMIEGYIQNPTLHACIRELFLSQGMVKAPCPPELLKLRQTYYSHQRAAGKLRVVGALRSTYSTRETFFRTSEAGPGAVSRGKYARFKVRYGANAKRS